MRIGPFFEPVFNWKPAKMEVAKGGVVKMESEARLEGQFVFVCLSCHFLSCHLFVGVLFWADRNADPSQAGG